MEIDILLDVDGVLADFATPAVEILNRLTGQNLSPHEVDTWHVQDAYAPFVPPDKFPHVIESFRAAISTRGFCAELPVLPHAKEAVATLRAIPGIHVYPCTSPSLARHWVYERAQWLWKHFQFPHNEVIHTAAKFKCDGAMLVDDHVENVEKWLARRRGVGAVWHTPQNKNQNLPRWPHAKPEKQYDRPVRMQHWNEIIAQAHVLLK